MFDSWRSYNLETVPHISGIFPNSAATTIAAASQGALGTAAIFSKNPAIFQVPILFYEFFGATVTKEVTWPGRQMM
jgi:hypothetical protein